MLDGDIIGEDSAMTLRLLLHVELLDIFSAAFDDSYCHAMMGGRRFRLYAFHVPSDFIFRRLDDVSLYCASRRMLRQLSMLR